jgi:hypothetical protein
VRAESGVEAEKLKSVKELNSSQNPNPSHPEGFGTLYDVVGSVKGHVEFASRERLVFVF